MADVVARRAPLTALGRSGVLRSGPEEAFDRLTRFAIGLLDVPVALVSLIDGEDQYLKSAIGLAEPWATSRRAPLSHSVCQHVVAHDGPLSVDDARQETDLHENRAIEGFDPASYAGVPVRSAGGEIIGAFCIVDSKPRRWDTGELELLEELAAAAGGEIELRSAASRALRRDPLTGLATRDQFVGRIAATLEAIEGLVVVLAVDVPILDTVTDSLGRPAADRLLVSFAARLGAGLPVAVLARVGDGLFAVLSASLTGAEAMDCVHHIRDLLVEPFEVEGHVLAVRPNIGFVLGDRTDEADALLTGAISSLRRARKRPQRLEVLDEARLRTEALERLTVENALRLALQKSDALTVAYQPKLRLADGALIGFEALARWEDPELGAVPPSTFIPVAEASGLIVALGEVVLTEACRQATTWRAAFPALDLSMAVNLSPRQIELAEVSELVAEVLRGTGLPARRLVLELTESALLEKHGAHLGLLEGLEAMGVTLELDDFGVGYSSLSHLASLPLDGLKIDRSFVADLEDKRVRGVVRAIIAMARALGLGVTAEGIETRPQLDQLAAMGCGQGQGYLFCRPQPPAALEDLLSEANRTES